MDVEQVADELYGLKPGEFTAARDAYVAEARRAKDSAAAKTLAALRRPATAAWAANLLARRQPEEAARFLALGETLREAHRNLDGDQLRAASRQQHQLVTALARTAAGLAREAGQPVSDTVLHEVEQTLHAALAHPDVAESWAKGRLAKVPEAAVGFGEIAPETLPVRPTPAKASERKKSPDREGERRKAELEAARAEVAEAEAVVARRERELGEAQDAERAVVVRTEEAVERVRRLEEELGEARTAVRGTKTAAAEAEAAVQSADRALSQARRATERAGREVERLKRAGQ
ncbi:hypothetical protein R1T08_00610 [Streptomyces sp. SBC-4]|nr:hypothetical protein [Streptomyces sp. SBC-4]MDV5142865.1 hypothetical protein [Streptomyces sp. SBC-4]